MKNIFKIIIVFLISIIFLIILILYVNYGTKSKIIDNSNNVNEFEKMTSILCKKGEIIDYWHETYKGFIDNFKCKNNYKCKNGFKGSCSDDSYGTICQLSCNN